MDNNKGITGIVGKPIKTINNLAMTGIYMYDNEVFKIIEAITPSARGELEITSVNNEYLRQGKLKYDYLQGDWIDAGSFAAYQWADKILRKLNNKIIDGDANENTL